MERFMGPGGAGAGKRREATLRLQERRKRDRQAYQPAHTARGLGRERRPFVP